MRDWSGETQVYVRWQKAAEEQKRFDKAKTLSCLASRDHPAALNPLRHITGNPKLFRARGSLGLFTRIVPHQLRHTYASEMLRAGVGLVAVMKLLGHTSPEMTMQYLDVTLNDLQRAFELARSKPRHLVPQPRVPSALLREGLGGVIDSLLAAQHVLEMFRRELPHGTSRLRLDRLSNRLTKILRE